MYRGPGAFTIYINTSLDPGRNDRDGWWYNASRKNFVREYGRTDPYEDFATSFAAYFMGSDYHIGQIAEGQTSGGWAGASDKMNYMDWFTSYVVTM